jgi:hypothetical protein
VSCGGGRSHVDTVLRVGPRRAAQHAEGERRGEERFGFAAMNVVSFEDLFAGKLVAALDRQHPRDLFDVKLLLEAEGIGAPLFEAFIVYLLSHNRTFAEVLDPVCKDIREVYGKGFQGMPLIPVSLEELLSARQALIAGIQARIGERERTLLLSFKRLEPDWSLLAIPHVSELPAVCWKLHNLARMDSQKRESQIANLERVFDRIAGR